MIRKYFKDSSLIEKDLAEIEDLMHKKGISIVTNGSLCVIKNGKTYPIRCVENIVNPEGCCAFPRSFESEKLIISEDWLKYSE